jgi:hypothetical protein
MSTLKEKNLFHRKKHLNISNFPSSLLSLGHTMASLMKLSKTIAPSSGSSPTLIQSAYLRFECEAEETVV